MDLIPIGQAAAALDMTTSTLRYYDERGLVRPSARRGGTRMYDAEQLRRLAFVKVAQTLGLSLDAAGAVLDAPGARWRAALGRQIEEFDQVIARARVAQTLLSHLQDCPADHPARECPTMTAALDRLIAGTPISRLLDEQS